MKMYVFRVRLSVRPELGQAERNLLLDRFDTEAIDCQGGVQYGGNPIGGGACVEARTKKELYGAHRHRVLRWIRANSYVIASGHVSRLFDGASEVAPDECRRRFAGRVRLVDERGWLRRPRRDVNPARALYFFSSRRVR